MFGILKAIVAWVILMLVGTNIIGFLVRGLVHQSVPHEDEFETEFVRGLVRRVRRWDTVATAGWAVLCLGYLYLLFRWWNLTVALAGLVLMLARLPELLFELRTGLSYSAEARRISAMNMSRGARVFCDILAWSALPLLWWGVSRR